MTDQNERGFYWRTARDSLLTPLAISLFQVAASHEGEDFSVASPIIDKEYESLRSAEPTQRHGGNFQTYIRVFEEAGWMHLEDTGKGKLIKLTPAGKQALVLFRKLPDFLKAIPYFLVELLARFQLNNPGGPTEVRNTVYEQQVHESNIFPYWTLWKIMRAAGNRITTDELRRFVFKIKKVEEIDKAISSIKSYRQDKENGMSPEEIDQKYGLPLDGAVGEPKFIMARAGRHIGKHPPLITKPDPSTFELNPAYQEFIDEIVRNENVFKEYIDESTWFKDYGSPVDISATVLFPEESMEIEKLPEYMKIEENDPFWTQVIDLIKLGNRNLLFVGPPGTSKTTYALSIGAKLADYDAERFRNYQFHQALGYDDFIEGYAPVAIEGGPPSFKLQKKSFLQICESAQKLDKDKFFVVVIDELNRGDPSRIFGETLTYLERRGEPFRLAYSGKSAMIPNNLVVIATMNPYDKSIADIDQALDRRFAKVKFPPSATMLRKMLIEQNGMNPELAGQVVIFFEQLITDIENRIGHAYFKDAKDIDSLKKVWEHQIQPVLEKEMKFNPEKLKATIEKFQALGQAKG